MTGLKEEEEEEEEEEGKGEGERAAVAKTPHSMSLVQRRDETNKMGRVYVPKYALPRV